MNHPCPMALMAGCATIVPTQLKTLRTKLFTATPPELRFGMNSVNMVVAAALTRVSYGCLKEQADGRQRGDTYNTAIEAAPKKKVPMSGTTQKTSDWMVHAYKIRLAG